jgi:RNA polymerase sigma factor (sigma-70 family)
MKAALNTFTDSDIIEGIKNNENWALDKLYKLNRDSFFNYVRINHGNDDDASDVLQDAVIVVYEKIVQNKLELTSSLKTYLTSVCNHIWYNKQRKKGKMVRMPDFFEETIADDISDQEPLNEIQIKLMSHFEKLGEKCRDLLTERFWKKKKMNEIADGLGKNLQSVKMDSSRCIQKLYDMFDGKMATI